jgi:hypothetical protein
MDKRQDGAHDLRMARTIFAFGFALTLCGSATALEQPVIWPDGSGVCGLAFEPSHLAIWRRA